MKIKSFLVLSAIVLLAHSISAQSAQLKGGINWSNVSVSDNGTVDDAKMLTSFHVGLLTDIQLSPVISLQPGIIFTGKGAKTQFGNETSANYYKATSNPFYIEVPLNFVFKASIGGNNKFFAGAGPYLAVGISGKTKTEGKFLGVAFSREKNIEFSNDDPATFSQEEGGGLGVVKRFDYGLNGTVGIEGKSMVLGVNYGLGLAKLQSGSNSSADNNNKHRVLSFSVGIKL